MPDATEDANTQYRVAVIGAGVIGTSVAVACLRAGHDVVLIDRRDKDWDVVCQALRQHQRLLRLTASLAPKIDIDRVVLSHDLVDVEGADLIVENITEVSSVKQELYKALGRLNIGDVPIAANTSAITISSLAAAAPDPTRVIGVHFMNPVTQIDTVEVVRGPATSRRTLDDVLDFLTRMGKTGVVVNDSPGFVVNRILMVMINQAAQLVAADVATAFDVDRLFKGCLGHSMGPLRTADLIGIDTVVDTLRVLTDAYEGYMFEPAERLLQMVQNAQLGMKTGRGFYEYETRI